MKKIILAVCAISILALLSSCCKSEEPFKMSDLHIRGEKSSKLKAEEPTTPTQPTWHEIVRREDLTIHLEGWEKGATHSYWGFTGFHEKQRDLVNDILLMKSTDIINQHGDELRPDWLESRNMFFVLGDPNLPLRKRHIVAYIPNAQIIEAEKIIKAAWARRDLQTISTTFQNAFQAKLITTEEFWKLYDEGKN